MIKFHCTCGKSRQSGQSAVCCTVNLEVNLDNLDNLEKGGTVNLEVNLVNLDNLAKGGMRVNLDNLDGKSGHAAPGKAGQSGQSGQA